MDMTIARTAATPATDQSRRPFGLARQVALMAAHRDSIATPRGIPLPLEQHRIDTIVDRLAARPVRRPQAGQH
jgi:hypothetical protein